VVRDYYRRRNGIPDTPPRQPQPLDLILSDNPWEYMMGSYGSSSDLSESSTENFEGDF